MATSSTKAIAAQARKTKERQARFNAAQAALPEVERLFNRQDFDDFVVTQVSLARGRAFASIQRWFVEFLLDPAGKLCGSKAQAESYFTKNGPQFTVKLVRMFAEYLTVSRVGNIKAPWSNGKLHLTTIHSYLELLFSSAARKQNPIDKAVQDAAQNYVDGRLVSKGMVNLVSRKKELTLAR